jgi:hypothetical protein
MGYSSCNVRCGVLSRSSSSTHLRRSSPRSVTTKPITKGSSASRWASAPSTSVDNPTPAAPVPIRPAKSSHSRSVTADATPYNPHTLFSRSPPPHLAAVRREEPPTSSPSAVADNVQPLSFPAALPADEPSFPLPQVRLPIRVTHTKSSSPPAPPPSRPPTGTPLIPSQSASISPFVRPSTPPPAPQKEVELPQPSPSKSHIDWAEDEEEEELPDLGDWDDQEEAEEVAAKGNGDGDGRDMTRAGTSEKGASYVALKKHGIKEDDPEMGKSDRNLGCKQYSPAWQLTLACRFFLVDLLNPAFSLVTVSSFSSPDLHTLKARQTSSLSHQNDAEGSPFDSQGLHIKGRGRGKISRGRGRGRGRGGSRGGRGSADAAGGRW